VFFLSLTVISLGYTFRDFEWLQYESDHFIYIYHKEIEESIGLVKELAEESYAFLSDFYGRDFSQKIILILSGYEDDANGLANPALDYVYSTTIEIDYAYRSDYYWLKTVISHELGHLFQLTSVTPIGTIIRKYLSRLYLPNALQPMWLTEGFAQISSKLLGADGYDARRLSFLKDQLTLQTPFTEEAIVAGFSPIGSEAYYNFGFAFLDYLLGEYGEEKLRKLVELRSGVFGFTGIELVFFMVFGKSYGELKEEFINYERSKYGSVEPPTLYRYSKDIDQGIQHFKPKVYGDRLYYIAYNRNTRYYSLNVDGRHLLYTTLEIVDYTVFESEVALSLLEKGNGLETRLYFYNMNTESLTRSKYSHILSLEYLGKDRLAILKNEKGSLIVQTLSLRNDRTTDIFSQKDARTQISNLRASSDGLLIAFKVNFEGKRFLALHSTRNADLRFFELDSDFSIGNWYRDGFLVSIDGYEEGTGVFLFRSDGSLEGQAFFTRYVRDSVKVREGTVASGQVNGMKLLVSSQAQNSRRQLTEVPLELDTLDFVYGKRYNGFANWRFVSLVPLDGIYAVFSDFTFRNLLIAGGSLNFETLEPRLYVKLTSNDYLPVDFEAKVELNGMKPVASLDVFRQYSLSPKLSLGWSAKLEYPLKLSGAFNVSLQDESFLYGGQAKLNTVITVRDTQTATTNVADSSVDVNLNWLREDLRVFTNVFSRVTLGKDSSVVPVRRWGFESHSSIVFGTSIKLDYTLSRRNLNLLNIVHFSKEGLGTGIDVLVGSTVFWRLLFYKSETVYLYAAYPFEIRAGLMLEGTRLLPYFDFELLY